MNDLIAPLVLLQLVLPLGLIVLNALIPSASRVGLLLRGCAIGLVLVYLALVGLWLFPPWWTPWALAGLHALLVMWRWPRTHSRRMIWRLTEAALAVMALSGITWVIIPPVVGRVMPDVAIDLAMPLGPGRYIVMSGGTAPAINNHLMTLAPRFADSRGQSYGVDIIAIDRWGLRADGIAPVAADRYLITGTPVLSPCTGQVAQALDGRPDNPVPQMDRTVMAGNHVLLECDGLIVLLAHMTTGSVAVATGDQVSVGQMLGRVGNSGNSAEPHLHLHVQRPAAENANPLSGDPVWFTVEGRFLVRGQRLVVGQGS